MVHLYNQFQRLVPDAGSVEFGFVQNYPHSNRSAVEARHLSSRVLVRVNPAHDAEIRTGHGERHGGHLIQLDSDAHEGVERAALMG